MYPQLMVPNNKIESRNYLLNHTLGSINQNSVQGNDFTVDSLFFFSITISRYPVLEIYRTFRKSFFFVKSRFSFWTAGPYDLKKKKKRKCSKRIIRMEISNWKIMTMREKEIYTNARKQVDSHKINIASNIQSQNRVLWCYNIPRKSEIFSLTWKWTEA